jgi:hypothetical protein
MTHKLPGSAYTIPIFFNTKIISPIIHIQASNFAVTFRSDDKPDCVGLPHVGADLPVYLLGLEGGAANFAFEIFFPWANETHYETGGYGAAKVTDILVGVELVCVG